MHTGNRLSLRFHILAAFISMLVACGGSDTSQQGGGKSCCDPVHASDPLSNCDDPTYICDTDPSPLPANNVTIAVDNSTAVPQSFHPTGYVLDGTTGKTTMTWDPGVVVVNPGQRTVFTNVMYAPVGSRVGLDVWLFTSDPNVKSGRGFSIGISGGSVNCNVWTTGMAPPNGVDAKCY